MNWNDDYKREETPRAEAGDYRVSIKSVEEKTSSKGNPMLVITLALNGTNITVRDYIVKNDWFNKNMTQFFDSFNIEEGDFDILTWVGAVGAAHFKNDEKGYLKRAWYIDKAKAEKLPAWIGDMPERQTVTTMEELGDDDDLPFEL